MSLIEKTASELLALQDRGEATAEAVAPAFLAAVRDRDPAVKAFLHVDEESVLAQAQAVDAKRKAGRRLGLLAGVPVAVKDVLCTKRPADDLRQQDAATTSCRPTTPTSSSGCAQADAVLLGKTNMDEFAMGSSTENSAYPGDAQPVGPRAHPRRLQRRLGGGGGGVRSAAVAWAPTPAARSASRPACAASSASSRPMAGCRATASIAFASSLDQVGPFAHDVADAALLLEVIAGHDPRDSTSVDRPVPAYIADARRAGRSR